MECSSRPNRSDIRLSKEEEMRMEEETREHFDGLAPKRHTKPQRSEHSSNYVDVNTTANVTPEYIELQRLENDPEKLGYNNGSEQAEEFVETDYYKDLNGVDKQHHKTGTGFIKIEESDDKSYSIAPETDFTHHAANKGNPATNDWIPAEDDQITLVSEKPHRSDG